MMKCELCKFRARIFCESDQASLCWTCDARVHSANFLVARHSRTLLCRACNSLTPWKGTGAALANAVSVCHRCAIGERQEDEESEGRNHVVETDTEEDGDNQVVPWSPSTPPPPLPASSSSGSEESIDGDGDGYEQQAAATSTTATSLKRQREDDVSDRDIQEGSDGGKWREEWRRATENRR